MENIQCNLCKSHKNNLLYQFEDELPGVKSRYSLVECENCHLIYLNPKPAPSEILSYYPDTYAPYNLKQREKSSPIRQYIQHHGLHRRCRAITTYKEGGYLLDIGASTGNFLNAMKQCGKWELYGVEFNEIAAQVARNLTGTQIFTGELEDANYKENFFDVVTLWDVLEHVYFPRATLIEIYRILKPNGLLILQLPNPDSWEAQLFKQYWAGWDPPRHLHIFSAQTIKLILQETGFKVDKISYFAGGYETFISSLQKFAEDQPERWKTILQKFAHLKILRLILFPLFWVIRRLRKSPSMIIFATKTTMNKL